MHQKLKVNSDPSGPKVAILMCTYNGQRYLAEQLDSFMRQTYSNWKVWVSDDGSQDNTWAMLEDYKTSWPSGRLSLHHGPGKGFSSNFFSSICNNDINAEYFAYSDQDDVWDADKLARAVTRLNAIEKSIPALYCSRTLLVDHHNIQIGLSPKFCKPPSFANALVQNIGGGNTMVLNRSARELLREGGEHLKVVSHDWWTYLLVSGCGGRVIYDSKPTLRYRQHGQNLVGMNATSLARFKRIRMLWRGQFRQWIDKNIHALLTMSHRLTPENQALLACFMGARHSPLISRIRQLKRCGIYRQKSFDNLGLTIAAIFKKV